MPVSTIEYAKEIARQQKTSDFNFLRHMLYYFELVIPAAGGNNGKQNFLFPLVLAPEAISFVEPFSVEATETIDGGLYIEENGIIKRELVIKGNTGFRPRLLQTTPESNSSPIRKTVSALTSGLVSTAPVVAKPDVKAPINKSYSRNLPTKLLSAISGHKHFQYLQDSIFRTYSDLKKDPVTSVGTILKFHNPKDEEHWEVVPLKFSLDRSVDKRFLYNYTIELLIVGPAEVTYFDYSEDKTILDQFKDSLNMVKKGIDLITGGVNDLIRLQGEVRCIISDITSILDSVTRISDSVRQFIDGNTRLIESSKSINLSVIDLIEDNIFISVKLNNSGRVRDMPIEVVQPLRRIVRGLEYISIDPKLYSNNPNEVIVEVKSSQIKSKSSSDAIDFSLGLDQPTSFKDLIDIGGGFSLGEALSIPGEINIDSTPEIYISAIPIEINLGDTLSSLAAKYMGDYKLWTYIAIINGLRPPFVNDIATIDLTKISDESPFKDSLGIGSKILIPTNTPASVNYPLLPIIGTEIIEPIENQILGVGVRIDSVDLHNNVYSDNTKYDVPINFEKGATDIKIVEGLPNIVQCLVLKAITEQGSYILHKNFGINSVIGSGFLLSDEENIKYRIKESLLSDARIVDITKIDLSFIQDQLLIELTLSLRGILDSKTIQIILR